jgi:integrase
MTYTGARALRTEELEAIIATLTGRYAIRDRAWILLGANTGFRISELLSIRVCDVWENGAVRSQVTVKKDSMKGKKKSRSMVLNNRAADAIKLLLSVSKMTHPFHAQSFLFHAQGDATRPMTRRHAHRIIVMAASKAGVSSNKVSSHSLRKTFASNLWDSPFVQRDIVKLARILGHDRPANTFRYVQFLDDSLEQAVMGLGRTISNPE